jgi:hypothetical protein
MMDDRDYRTLMGDMQQVADQMRDHLRQTQQIVRNFSRLANAVSDTVTSLRGGYSADAMEACRQALGDVGSTAYENDYDTPEWCVRFLGEQEDDE